MQITSLTVSENKDTLKLNISDAADVTILRLWNDKTYKNYEEAIDLSSKLTGSATQELTITLSDISEPYLDGVYFVEAKDDDEVSTALTAELARFKECIMNKLLKQTQCDDCLKSKDGTIYNSHSMLLALEDAITLRFPSKVIEFKKALDRFCSNKCRSCGDFSNIVTTESKDSLNPNTIIVTLDGGSLD